MERTICITRCTVLATDDKDGYYADYADAPASRLRAGASPRASSSRARASAFRDGARRGEPSSHAAADRLRRLRAETTTRSAIPPSATRLSHRANAERVRLVAAIMLLSPQVPLLFMGEEWGGPQPFPFFCDFAGALAEQVPRTGRRREFAGFGFGEDVPEPLAAEASVLWRRSSDWSGASSRSAAPRAPGWCGYRRLLALRAREIGAAAQRHDSGGSYPFMTAQDWTVAWRLGDGTQLILRANFGAAALACRRGAGAAHPMPARAITARTARCRLTLWRFISTHHE